MIFAVTVTRETRHTERRGEDTIVWYNSAQLPSFQLEAGSKGEAMTKARRITEAKDALLHVHAEAI